MKPVHLLFALPLILAGCVATLPDGGGTGDLCGASSYEYLVGRPGVLLDGMRFSQEVRVIQSGMAVTMDFMAERLNFRLDERDVIREVTCG